MPTLASGEVLCYLLYMAMDVISYTHARNKLKEVMDKVCEDHTPVTVFRRGAPAVVVLSLEDYQSLDETAYLKASPANAAALRESIAQIERGEVVSFGSTEEALAAAERKAADRR